MSTTKLAPQGIRQPAVVKRILPNDKSNILLPGRIIISMKYPNRPEEQSIPEGCIGIIHTDSVKEISIVRDDCKAARKAIRLAEASVEELEDIAHQKKDIDCKLGYKAETKTKVEANFKPVNVVYTLRERTLKQYSLTDACNAAIAILQSKYNYNQLCTDILKGKSETQLLTTVEMGELVHELVDDTIYWAGGFTTTGPLV